MARAIRFTKPERELIIQQIKAIVDCPLGIPKGTVKAAQSAMDKLAASEAPLEKLQAHLTPTQAIAIFREVLGSRLLVPPNGASLVFIKMQHRLKSLGLTRDDCFRMAEQARREWTRGNIKAESIINNSELLLQNAAVESCLPVSDSSSGDEDTLPDVMTDL